MIVCDQLSILLIIGQVFIHIYWRYLNTITISILKMFFFTISKNLSEACSIFCVNPDSDFTRNKIRLEVFKNLFDGSNKKTFTKKLYHGYRILAINDSVLFIDNTIFDDEIIELRHGILAKPYSAYHLNTSYNLPKLTYPKRMRMILSVSLLTDISHMLCGFEQNVDLETNKNDKSLS